MKVNNSVTYWQYGHLYFEVNFFIKKVNLLNIYNKKIALKIINIICLQR